MRKHSLVAMLSYIHLVFLWRVFTTIRYTICLFMFVTTSSYAATFVLSEHSDLVGEIEYATPQSGETLADVGLRYDIGYYEMVDANPNIDKTGFLSPNSRLLIPSQFILPKGSHHGMVINLAEFRLYFFPENENIVMTFPIGIGRKGWNTPVGKTSIIAKQVNPTWYPSTGVLLDAAKHGVQFPDAFPGGPGNPLGLYALRLGWPTYLIHGSNHSRGIGERISAGCIRMLPDDIAYLYSRVSIGLKVRVVNEAIKIGLAHGVLYMEVHPPLFEQRNIKMQSEVALYITQQKTKARLNHVLIDKEVLHPTGVPKKIEV